MHLSSFLTIMALAISSAYSLPQAADDTVCLRLCRDEPVSCPDGWTSAQISSGDEVRFMSLYGFSPLYLLYLCGLILS